MIYRNGRNLRHFLKSNMGWTFLFLALFNPPALTPHAFAKDVVLVDDVPILANAKPVEIDQSGPFSRWPGLWLGSWDGRLKHALNIQSVDTNGKVSGFYSIGPNKWRNTAGRWLPLTGLIEGEKLFISNEKFGVSYQMSSTGRLKGIFQNNSGFAVLEKHDYSAIISKAERANWSPGKQIFIDIYLTEQRKNRKLETILYFPKGKGPFPLAIINHGSTGNGTDENIFKSTWKNEWLAELLNEKGWIAAFPQRRGRGKSEGKYDEGLSENRTEGYSCDTSLSLAGAERALDDIDAAINALKKLPEVSNAPILIGGQSRGGILSIAYAGRHKKTVAGAINFVGGWMGDACANASAINQSLFNEGAQHPKKSLWIYGKDDVFYSKDHTMDNFDSFLRSGGKGEFLEVTVPGKNNGHYAILIPTLWTKELTSYLEGLVVR